jgi:hypothetical protein
VTTFLPRIVIVDASAAASVPMNWPAIRFITIDGGAFSHRFGSLLDGRLDLIQKIMGSFRKCLEALFGKATGTSR